MFLLYGTGATMALDYASLVSRPGGYRHWKATTGLKLARQCGDKTELCRRNTVKPLC
ncbi:hypothetical protein [Escherichia coli]|uniref:hypothetical protein n=1 Tax=Escherichia coli TaxID=562 RepID=UPI001910B8C9|nr:hypothetical protein [Escherichia coli]